MEKKEETKEAPEARTRFNTVALHKSSRRNAIRAYVHSDSRDGRIHAEDASG